MSTRERVDTLENALKELAYAGRRTEMSLAEFQAEARERDARMDEILRSSQERLDLLSTEMGNFKEEARADREESRRYREESRRKEEEWRRAEEESRRAEEEWRRERKEIYRQWGALANKMGTLVEDMVVPNFPHVLERYFGVAEIDDMLVGRRKRHPQDRHRIKEFDLLAWTADTLYWNETKSTATFERFKEFIEDESVFEYFPELADRNLVKIGSALFIPDEVIAYLTRSGCYAMMLTDETMDIVNFSEIAGSPRPSRD